MTTLHHAPYRSDVDDFPRVLAFLREAGQHPGFLADMHPGDAVWQRFRAGSAAFDPATRIALWADETGQDVALGWLDPPDTWICVVHPAVLPTEIGTAAVVAVLAWIEERRAQSACDGTSPGAITVTALDEDTRLTALLLDHGFTPEPELDLVTTRQSLDDPIPACALPDGYRVVDLTDSSFVERHVAIHLEVWHPSAVTLDGYRELQRQPLYDPALDLMAVTEEDEPAAYVLNWLDSPTRTALFEPVGTRVAHRRRGLSRALLVEGMRRARDRGATVQYVNHVGDVTNPSVALYRAAGFRPVGHWRLWTRRVEQ